MSVACKTVRTTHGEVSVVETCGKGLPVLLVHGNSSCKEVFRRQIESPEAEIYRMVAFDLPGHGRSSDACDPARTYSVSGYADVALELLDTLGIQHAAVFGWSYGGHIALEMLHRHPGIAGVMIVGAPPIASGILGVMRGYQLRRDMHLLAKSRLTPREIKRFARVCLGETSNRELERMIVRTDERVRPLLARSMMSGDWADQKVVLERAFVPVAIVNGSQEPFAELSYLESLCCPTLWEGRCHVLDGAGHAPFRQTPDSFDPVFRHFLEAVARGDESRSLLARAG